MSSTMHSTGLCDTRGKDTKISVLENSMESLQINNNNDNVSAGTKDTLCFPRSGRVSSLEDVLEEGHHGCPPSPKPNRVSRSPRRRFEDEQFGFPLSQNNLTRLRNRRRSDPGRISVSPLRTRLRIDNISEDGDYENRNIPVSSLRVPVRRATSLDPTEIDEAVPIIYGIRSRSRSPQTQTKFRTQRSSSLPGLEYEFGEAIGALAMRKSPYLTEVNRAPLYRRRSVSVESPAPLEAILEENAANQKSSRRFSSPAVKSPTAPL